MNYLSKFISDYLLQELENNLIEVDEDLDLEKIVLSKLGRLSDTKFIVLEICNGKFTDVSKLDSLSETFNIDAESIILPFKNLEEAFHDSIIYQR